MSDIIKLPRGEFTWTNTDYDLHGQHYKLSGSCGFVHYYLIDKESFALYLKRKSNR